jgi:hypothetical protein
MCVYNKEYFLLYTLSRMAELAPQTKPIPNLVQTNIKPDYASVSQYLTGESQQNVEFIRNWIMRLSPNERDELLRVNTLANTLQKSADEYKDPLNMSLREFAKEWANKNMEAMAELLKWLTNIGEYARYFDDVDNSRQWFSGVYAIIRDFFSIFWKNSRSIYVGITLLFLVFFIIMIEMAEGELLTSTSKGMSAVSSNIQQVGGVQYAFVPVNALK